MNEFYIDSINKTVNFKFSFNEELKRELKNCNRDSRWNPELKEWVVPVNDYTKSVILNIIKKYDFKQKVIVTKDVKFSYKQNAVDYAYLRGMCDSKGFTYNPREYQLEALGYALEKGSFINGDDVGCISGDAIIQMSRAKKSSNITLSELYRKFNGGRSGNRKWNLNIPTLIKSFDEDRQIFVHNEVDKVLYKGVKKTIKITLNSGKSVTLTPDHEVYCKDFGWIESGNLKVGDFIFSNGQRVCKTCDGTDNLIQLKESRFYGHCKKCMYQSLKNNGRSIGGKHLDKDGYVLVSGIYDHPRTINSNKTRVSEHILVMEKHLGRYLINDEVVHHKNHIKNDNRICNLSLETKSSHAKSHSEKYLHLDTEKCKIVPVNDEIVLIEDAGNTRVYDIVMKDPHRNFVANKILVHNCGKTFESIMYAETTNSFPCLVIVPASVKGQWKDKWEEIVGKGRTVATIKSKPTKKHPNNWDADVVIINYDIIGTKQGTGTRVKFEELIKTDWKMLICDEAHFLKQKTSQRSQAAKKICKKDDLLVQLLTGTAVMSKPVEIWNLLTLIDKSDSIAADWFQFIRRYCGGYKGKYGWVTDGATNILELNQKLRENCYIRREKRDVLTELPDVTKQVIQIPITNKVKIDRATDDFIEYMKESKGEEAAERAMEAEHLVAIGVLRKLAIEGKIKGIEQYLKDWKVSGNKKLVVFGIHKEGLQQLSEKFKCPLISGGVSSEKKHKIVQDWIVNDDIFLFANTDSAGTGVDGLQKVCSNMLIIELPWRPSDLTQVIGRLDRSGQLEPTTVSFMLNDYTIDKEMWEMLELKEQVTEAVNKGIDVKRNKSGMKAVIKKILKKAL